MIRIVQLSAKGELLEGVTGDGRRIHIVQKNGWLVVTCGVQDKEMKQNEGNVLRLKVAGPLAFEEIIGYCRGLVRFF